MRDSLSNEVLRYETRHSKFVSAITRSIASYFNWVYEKTQIQNTGKVRSFQGLIVHAFVN
ncbi:hypothetical protein [Gelidibacter salicanalis]|uniref:Uncharacterized protein n=1 Tax=Gelidibacter salicanalis TaxID=291193 RepID=A0A934NDS7_9FLAO|nr:hypothetical protein [Gelidibacter salicanalis]MBJ7882000.1 hypothetical protein [Gelidibacter salicanalis]